MTTPTQVRVEAEQLLDELRNPCGIQTQYTKAMYGHAAEVIEKLLAAAAEVGHWLDNPTAEQVEERWERCFKDAADNIRRKERERCEKAVCAATIERCAKVADMKGDRVIADRIRALKEQA